MLGAEADDRGDREACGWEPGETVDATVRGDTAFSRSLELPILLIALGLPFLAIPVFAARAKRHGATSHTGPG